MSLKTYVCSILSGQKNAYVHLRVINTYQVYNKLLGAENWLTTVSVSDLTYQIQAKLYSYTDAI